MNSRNLNVSLSLLLFIFCLAISLATDTISRSPIVSAISGSDFNAGHIIDDGVFTNNGAMSAWDIQNFLNSKVPNCDVNGSLPKSYYYNSVTGEVNNSASGSYVTTTRAVYGQRYNNWYRTGEAGAPYICLKDYVQNPFTGQNNIHNPSLVIPGGASAAQLISYAADQYHINPQVILATLQKEQGLVTDDWPWTREYDEAMGFNCPDTPQGCSGYAGFYDQVSNAAKQMRYYLDHPYAFNYWTGNNNIQYSPVASCGSSIVNIQNPATAALYIYTPYQPNAAALAQVSDNSPGGAVPCGAYGNRNFWWYFTQWFGTTYADGYSAQNISQSAYPTLIPGQTASVFMQYKNVGGARWYDDTSKPTGISPVHLAATNAINRISVFSYGWPSGGRPNQNFSAVYLADGLTLAPNQHVVEPGQIARFQFNLTVPWSLGPGTYREYFQPIKEGPGQWSMGGISWFDITVKPANAAQFVRQSTAPIILNQNTSRGVFADYRNTGINDWFDDTNVPNGSYPVHLAATGPMNRVSAFSADWPSGGRSKQTFSSVYESDGVTLASDQHTVHPGQIARFAFNLTASSGLAPGSYREYFQPVIEGPGNWNMGGVSYFDAVVQSSNNSATFVSQSAFPTLTPGQSTPVYIMYRNSGTTWWYDDSSVQPGISPVHMAATNPINRNSMFSYGWPAGGRSNLNFSAVYEADGITLSADQHLVKSGQIVKYSFNLTAPWTLQKGLYREYFQPVREGPGNWNMSGIAWLDISIK